jgi:hypothetical protein
LSPDVILVCATIGGGKIKAAVIPALIAATGVLIAWRLGACSLQFRSTAQVLTIAVIAFAGILLFLIAAWKWKLLGLVVLGICGLAYPLLDFVDPGASVQADMVGFLKNYSGHERKFGIDRSAALVLPQRLNRFYRVEFAGLDQFGATQIQARPRCYCCGVTRSFLLAGGIVHATTENRPALASDPVILQLPR